MLALRAMTAGDLPRPAGHARRNAGVRVLMVLESEVPIGWGQWYPCAVFAGPDHRNMASRRVLEKNGFVLRGVRPLPSEPTDDPVAVYRLSRAGTGPAPPPGC